MLNMNYNPGLNGAGSSAGCGCQGAAGGGLGPMGGMGSMTPMNSQMMNMFAMTMMAMMTQLMQMLAGGTALSGGPGAFGGAPGSSPLGGFLGGGGGGGSGGGSSPVGGAPGGSASGGSAPTGNVDPSSVKDKTGTGGLSSAARAGLDQAHSFGLPLVSGKRSGNGTSDHDSGNAVDVGTLPIGAASSTGGTPQMKAYAESMRQAGKAGKRNVKYVIADGRIASARDNWEWRPYTYPGKTQAQLEQIKRTNRGEYNRLQHYDHVHVSFN